MTGQLLGRVYPGEITTARARSNLRRTSRSICLATLHVAWVDNRETQAIYYAQSSDNGQTWSGRGHRVNDNLIYIADSPAIAVRGAGRSALPGTAAMAATSALSNSSTDSGLTSGRGRLG